jgi:hypothetical protein
VVLKGSLTPLLGIGVCVSIQFAVLEYTKRQFATRNISAGRNEKLTGGQLFISGIAAGLANGFVSGPVEHIRIRESDFLLKFHDNNLLLFLQVCKRNRIRTAFMQVHWTQPKKFIRRMELLGFIKDKMLHLPERLVDMACTFGPTTN